MSNETQKILLIGNGFDLRTGVKTTFREFFRFVIYGIIWHNYLKSEVLRTIITNDNNLKFKLDSEVPREELFQKYFDEKINNKIQVIANIQKEKEKIEWEKEHHGENLLPSKHPLEILLEIEKEEAISEWCRKLIETEFGQKFFKHLLKSPYLEEALRIDLSNPSEWLLGYNVDNNLKDKFLRWSVIYGLKEAIVDTKEDDCISFDYLGEGLETITHIYESHLEKNLNNISLWSDVETVIELLITKDEKLKTKYNVKNDDLPIWNDETLKSFSEGLDIFEFILTNYLKAITDKLDIEERFGSASDFLESIYKAHEDSMLMRCTLRSLPNAPLMKQGDLLEFLKNPDMVINYNYTDIAKKIYKGKKDIKHVHINGQINPELIFNPSKEGLKTNIVIGYTNHNNNDVPKELYHFEKSCRRIVKNTEYFRLKPDNNTVLTFDLLIIGHSCCTADSDIIGNLLTHKKLHNALILCHTKDDLISINNNIKHILDPETYGNLMTHGPNKVGPSLFFAVEQPKQNKEPPEERKGQTDEPQ
ncbi:AbiH family protein [Succinimonas sp.]|uniref:AbiH family protein n=1 Tax=Succinimonas sp. TaxID=1936151 RepID=UPI00386FFF3F